MSEIMVYDEEKNVAYAGGIVIPLGRKPVDAKTIVDDLKKALATDYDGLDPTLKGLTKQEAGRMVLARRVQEGDIEAIKYVDDRIIGKPVQQINSMNVSATLQEFLDGISLPVSTTQSEEINIFEE